MNLGMYTQKQDRDIYIYIYKNSHEQKPQDCSRPKNEQKHLTIRSMSTQQFLLVSSIIQYITLIVVTRPKSAQAKYNHCTQW